ncbi:glycyl-radical enzyme activating protein family [Alkaliphilus metalliredigens QYMF]|uniref:Glycyl-radical enzyme activating protein family n=1 Tax=Alkaliphilus metalliredigens (strain QYMF) TaxID=293826 RepID=A6TKL6_ALKMQ|nr:glycyl-radical enzyme activating protein [Alkaliphilus metalliredigens]ABR46734.1 glycyl-radical enzyme activating protein family [Alkaliphilus metalliredigens QYMF]
MAESLLEIEGVIYNIQRYSIHDGTGIRTTVFFKGCPLRCLWCANPESQKIEIEEMGERKIGRIATVQEVLDVVSRDKMFYNRSGGGMTLSGGEPLMQPEFASALVKEAKRQDIHTAIETSGYQQWDLLWSVIENIDTVLFDIKTMDAQQHLEVMGTSNQLILENAKRIAKMNKEIILRIPIVPGYNDSWSNMVETVNFAKEIGIKEMHLLPYHQLGESKYKQLDRNYKLKGVRPPSKEKLQDMALKIHRNWKVNVSVI